MFAVFKSIYGGTLNRNGVLRPFVIISLCVIAVAAVVYWALVAVKLPDTDMLLQAMQTAAAQGDMAQVAKLQQGGNLAELARLWARILVLLGGLFLWLVLLSPVIIRRLRDAGRRVDWFTVPCLPILGLIVFYQLEVDYPISLPCEEGWVQAQNTLIACNLAIGTSVLLVLGVAYLFPSRTGCPPPPRVDK